MNESRMFLILAGLLFVWFMFGLNYLSPWINNNFMLAYTLFIFIDTYLVSRYILFPNEGFNFSKFFALALIFLATDIIMFPYLVTTNGTIEGMNSGAMMSSDVYIFNLIPNYVIPIAKYIIVYVLAPAFMLIIARGLTTKRWFWSKVGAASQ